MGQIHGLYFGIRKDCETYTSVAKKEFVAEQHDVILVPPGDKGSACRQ